MFNFRFEDFHLTLRIENQIGLRIGSKSDRIGSDQVKSKKSGWNLYKTGLEPDRILGGSDRMVTSSNRIGSDRVKCSCLLLAHCVWYRKFRGRLGEMGNLLGRQSPATSHDINLLAGCRMTFAQGGGNGGDSKTKKRNKPTQPGVAWVKHTSREKQRRGNTAAEDPPPASRTQKGGANAGGQGAATDRRTARN
ncbi:hypothetical protein LXL04_013889 [Taraxacum kok-saghyz]